MKFLNRNPAEGRYLWAEVWRAQRIVAEEELLLQAKRGEGDSGGFRSGFAVGFIWVAENPVVFV